MTKGKYALQEPNGVTNERLLEIKLYLFAQTHLNKLGQHSRFKADLIGLLCNVYNLDTSAILASFNLIESPQIKPTLKEIAVANHLMGIPVRFLTEQNIISSGNYYKLLQEYINEDEPTLQPKLNEIHHKNIKLFFENIESIFYYVSYLIKGVIKNDN